MNQCPCCKYYTIEGEGEYDICKVCFWEDDPSGIIYPKEAVGANAISLNKARKNYIEFGASEKRFLSNVRSPLFEELVENN
ncbi:hypothetical protein DOK76_00015 [Vagococcus sp. DIV0080]|uniref:Cysteine-rich CPCC domain-containing protein n=1 Tax=Candidatus Vagococcus giribetii TaxID=2230876 RepID=A0ABS3HNV3_9ENTE|nr:CPCC family cysteine-rich protein [Vagococcus sp. DIV0080]MBO0475429.1 hypothetical protein [Vagococcus sp. DIV0080]